MQIKIIKIYDDHKLFEQEINNLLKNKCFILDSIKVVGGTQYDAEFEQNYLSVVYVAVFKMITMADALKDKLRNE